MIERIIGPTHDAGHMFSLVFGSDQGSLLWMGMPQFFSTVVGGPVSII